MMLQNIIARAQRTILYFYPKDDTPGCTAEAIEFSLLADEFKKLKAQVVWVSKDSANSHCSFTEKHHLKIDLVSDPDLGLHKMYGARWEKNMYGKITEGTIRSTFIVSQDMEVIHKWKNVKAKWHAEQVFAWVSTNLKG